MQRNPEREVKRIAAVQSNYIPWKGYFDLIASVDAFVLLDDVQYTRRDWRNRNRIQTRDGPVWLTVPVEARGHRERTIRQTLISGREWAQQHWQRLTREYHKAPHFNTMSPHFEPIYADPPAGLSDLNRRLIMTVCAILDVTTPIIECNEFNLIDGKTERLVSLCQQTGADIYVSGPAAADYLDLIQFSACGIAVEWANYGGYPEYPQFWGPFVHEVSILDLLFNCGPDAARYMKYVRQK
jgi:WbqC-like protein family